MFLNNRYSFYMVRFLIILIAVTGFSYPQTGILRVGFDIDDTVIYSRDVFVNAPRNNSGRLDFGWINTHDQDYSITIEPVVTLINYFTAQGHEVFFITARNGENGKHLAKFLSQKLDMDIAVGKNLFFSPKERINGGSYTTKQKIMKELSLDLYYGDSDTDIIAALKADVHPVRIVRHNSSVEQYGSNYFGNTLNGSTIKAPFSREDLSIFYNAKVGVFGETIYPLIWAGPAEQANTKHYR